jgi:hypothetical protein
MTVNYTTNLSLGQPVTGTESGQWGNDVNNAITSYLDIAISGSLALTSASFTANALTLTNTLGDSSATNIGAPNASSQWTAQYYVLRLSSLAANVTITAPSVSKTYLVVNADATYSATIKASGQTGISVAAGERATVYYNGTDYIKVTSSVVSNLTGTLPVANGGTGLTSTPANGALDIGNGTGFTRTTLTAGSNVTITNSAGGITIASTNSGGTVTSVTGTAPVVSSGGNTPAISMAAATTSVSGYLTSTDWTTFNGKQAALVSGTNIKTVNSTSLLGSGDVSVGVTSVTGTAPVVSSGGATPAISMAAASTSVSGYLTSTDWNTFNGKQAAGSYVTSGGALGTPSSGTLTNCTFPALNQNTTGSAGSVATTNYSVVQSGAKLYFKYGGTNIASLDSSGNLIVLGNVTAYGTP